jgi:hypothetical protein
VGLGGGLGGTLSGQRVPPQSRHRSARVRSCSNALDLGRLGLGGPQHRKARAGADTPAQLLPTSLSPNRLPGSGLALAVTPRGKTAS